MQVSFFTSDLNSGINVTEAGVDYFYISNANVLGIAEENSNDVTVYPNPFDDELVIERGTAEGNTAGNSGADYYLCDLQGKEVLHGRLENGKGTVNTSVLKSGVYLFHMDNSTIRVMKD